ncbi:hypothetical protein [Salipaludibacillus aurantiacus]|uniref:Uncharacterized protein n=1 Tax=Salipaludibacillus aurantiacus TaxID=1601833 RepID=A0A1H9U2C7_9BACI|nr:hypothetical protein [Salipaludibacillus aurantiacus]SES03243.1 hypothetical protein SAMN05518684_106236 [Salipaludibacillus aurantiacus]
MADKPSVEALRQVVRYFKVTSAPRIIKKRKEAEREKEQKTG